MSSLTSTPSPLLPCGRANEEGSKASAQLGDYGTSMELRQSSQTTPDCCPMGRVTQFGVNADLVPLRALKVCPDASLAVDAAPLDPARLATKHGP